MTEATLSPTVPLESGEKVKPAESSLVRVAKYMGFRLVSMAITVVIGLYLTILIANMGGYVDEIRRGEIREFIQMQVFNDPSLKSLTGAERAKLVEQRIALEEKRLGLDKPFLVRSFAFLRNALTLKLGFAQYLNSDSGSKQVRLIILERLPPTLVLFGTVDLLLFFSTLFVALYLSRHYGSWLDKLIVSLSPMSAAPAWFYGVFLIIIFAAALRILPFGGMVDAPPPRNPVDYGLSLLKHMTLPALALALNSFAYSTFAGRTFFLIYSSEDYVEMAKAKGLNARDIERRYILRPTLPNIITNFAFLIISVWTGAPIFETVFNWPGLGRTTVAAVGLYDTPVIVGTTVLFSYLLAFTVFLLDFIYALVDPRVKIGSEGANR